MLSRGDGLAAKGGRGFFTSSLPGSTGSVNVVESSNTNVEVEIPTVGQGHFFGVQLFQAVHVLRPCRPGIRFDQTWVFRIFLLGFVVHTSTGGVEEVLNSVTTSSFQHVHGDGSVVEGKHRFVGDNESHASHVGGQVVDLSATNAGIAGNFQLAQVIQDEFITELFVLHELVLLPVNHNDIVTCFLHTTSNMTPNEAGSTADANLLSFTRGQCEFLHGRDCFFAF
mmetsp:Transcript_7034/g.14420  ORF Transcript_7034/g.14420 Transcript_7034/m.14420 type:complete len:225 (-) Transcript_7034:139-813(-)